MTALREALSRALGRRVGELRPVGGGDLNDAYATEFDDGERVFVKTADDAAPQAFTREAEGLGWLAEPAALAVAKVLAVADEPPGPRFLALEWIDRAARGAETDDLLGRGLARLHAAGAPAFGGDAELVLGPLTLPNDPVDGWPEFYATRRLEPLARLASDRGALPAEAFELLDRLVARLDDLCGPDEPPARLHGDLWSGNVLTGAGGHPWLIDPAAYGGHREVDLAMLTLFGSPGAGFLAAYREATPLADGYEDRVALWQVMPLLAHAALFGGGWGASAVSAMRRYVG
ncbi:MAG: fructosamine kinase family protein [Solirubrobacteraceae bacterium]